MRGHVKLGRILGTEIGLIQVLQTRAELNM